MKSNIIYVADFARILATVEETLKQFETVFPTFYQNLSIAYPWYMRWRFEWRIWKNGTALKHAWKELSHYKTVVEEARAEGFETLELDARIIRDLSIWGPEGIAREVMYELNRQDRKQMNPYR